MIITDLTKKYKDRSPEKTVELIKQFFSERGYTTKITINNQSEAKTWSCSVGLFKNGSMIMRTNGKGTTEAFSYASGYAELYERFCNNCLNIRNLPFCKKMTTLSKEKYGYYFHPEEKPLSFKEATNAYAIRDWFTSTCGNNLNYQQAVFNIITDYDAIGEPYTSLTNPEEKPYYDRRIVNKLSGSGGMAAGNTVEEALNQGLSEICEHYVAEIFFEQTFDNYHIINLDSIENPELQEKIAAIRANNSNIFIFDLGYNTGLPVVLSVLVNKYQICTNVNFGSFPVFDIAVERIITEIYQGIQNYNEFNPMQIPWSETNSTSSLPYQNALTGLTYFNEDIILNKSIITDTPSDCFLRAGETITNTALNQYFIDLFNKRNWSIHYINHGLIPEMAAVHIIIPEIRYNCAKLDYFKSIPADRKKFMIENVMRTHKFITEIIENYNNGDNFQETYNRFWAILDSSYDERHEGSYVGTLLFSDWLNPLDRGFIETSVVYYFFNDEDDQNQCNDANLTIFLPMLKKFATLRRYLNAGYSLDNIMRIFKDIFNNPTTIEEIMNCKNREYIFRKAYYDVFYDYYNSKEYEEIVESFIYKV